MQRWYSDRQSKGIRHEIPCPAALRLGDAPADRQPLAVRRVLGRQAAVRRPRAVLLLLRGAASSAGDGPAPQGALHALLRPHERGHGAPRRVVADLLGLFRAAELGQKRSCVIALELAPRFHVSSCSPYGLESHVHFSNCTIQLHPP